MPGASRSLGECLGILVSELEISGHAYRDYMASGQTYLGAVRLHVANTSLRQRIVVSLHHLPDDLRAASLKILQHLEVWMAQWAILRDELKPASDDAFIFETRVNFPRDAERLILNRYHSEVEGNT